MNLNNNNNSENVINAAYKGYKDGTVNFIGDQVEILTGYSKDVFNSNEKKWRKCPNLKKVLERELMGGKSLCR